MYLILLYIVRENQSKERYIVQEYIKDITESEKNVNI
jgi:hypothetical protein